MWFVDSNGDFLVLDMVDLNFIYCSRYFGKSIQLLMQAQIVLYGLGLIVPRISQCQGRDRSWLEPTATCQDMQWQTALGMFEDLRKSTRCKDILGWYLDRFCLGVTTETLILEPNSFK